MVRLWKMRCTKEMSNVYKIVVGEYERRRPFGKPRRKYEDVKELGCGGSDWIYLAQDRVQWHFLLIMVLNLLVP